MSQTDNEVEGYAAMLHTSQAAHYGIFIPYHIKRKKWWYVGAYAFLLAFHTWSAFKHIEDIE